MDKAVKKHYKNIGSKGGKSTLKKYGKDHYSEIGKLGKRSKPQESPKE